MTIRRIISSIAGKKLELKIFRPLNKKEFASLSKEISKFLPQKKKITMRHIEVHEFVKKKGGVPWIGKNEFWKDALKEWNRTHSKKNKYSTWRSFRMTYLRIKQKI